MRITSQVSVFFGSWEEGEADFSPEAVLSGAPLVGFVQLVRLIRPARTARGPIVEKMRFTENPFDVMAGFVYCFSGN
jgi:hypothetical protein